MADRDVTGKLGGAERFAAAASALGIEVDAVVYPEGTRTAADAAAAIGCELSQIVKSLLVMSDAGPALALTAGHNRVDLDKLSEVVGRPVRMANADEAREASGYAIGGTPPFGHPAPIPTFLDRALQDHEVVYGAAGTPDRCFPIESTRLIEATAAQPADFVV